MYNQKIRDIVAEFSEHAILFDGEAYDNSIIGVTEDGAAVYSYDDMVNELVEEYSDSEDPITSEEAIDWIDYNTMRAIPYAKSSSGDPDGIPPIVINTLSMELIAEAKNNSKNIENTEKNT